MWLQMSWGSQVHLAVVVAGIGDAVGPVVVVIAEVHRGVGKLRRGQRHPGAAVYEPEVAVVVIIGVVLGRPVPAGDPARQVEGAVARRIPVVPE